MATNCRIPTIPAFDPTSTECKSSSVTFQKKIGQLARLSQHTDPHVPVWVPGLNYPVQYVVRQTRSMMASNKTDNHNNSNNNEDLKLVVSISLSKVVRTSCSQLWSRVILPDVNKLRQLLKPLDFDLPDKTFLQLKLDKLKEIDKLKNNTSLTDAATGSTSITASLFRAAAANHNVIDDGKYSNIIKTPSGMLIISDIQSDGPNTTQPICSVFEFTYHQMQSVNNNDRMMFLSKPLRSFHGSIIWSLSHTSSSTLKLYCNDVVLGSIDVSSVNEVEVELVDVNNELEEVFACITDSKQCWVYTINMNKSILDLIFRKQLTNCRRESTSSTGSHCCRHWLPHKVGMAGSNKSEDTLVISFRKEGAIETFHLEKKSSMWSLSSIVVLPHSNNVESCCVCEGSPQLLLGLSNQKCKILIWDIVSSCMVSSCSISCQPLPSSFPLAILVHAGKKHGKSTDHVVNVVICLLASPTSCPLPSSVPIGWLVSCDTINVGQCQRILCYRNSTSNTNSNLHVSDATPAPHVVDYCNHGDYYSLLFSDDRVSSWNINQSNPVNSTSRLAKGSDNTIKGLC